MASFFHQTRLEPKSYTLTSIAIFDAEHNLDFVAINVSGGSMGGSSFFQIHAIFGNIWQNRMLVDPGELAPQSRGNPASATACTVTN